jgi:hypothetical protein
MTFSIPSVIARTKETEVCGKIAMFSFPYQNPRRSFRVAGLLCLLNSSAIRSRKARTSDSRQTDSRSPNLIGAGIDRSGTLCTRSIVIPG